MECREPVSRLKGRVSRDLIFIYLMFTLYIEIVKRETEPISEVSLFI
jgi:hypothetical protein